MTALRGLTRDTLVYGIGGSATRLIAILFVPIFTRIFSPGEYGALDLLTTQISILTVFAMVGLNSAVFYHYRRVEEAAERRRLVGSALVMATGVALLIGAIGLLLADDVARVVLGDAAYTAAVAASFVWLPVNVAVTLALDLLRLEFRPVAYTAIGIGRSLFAWAFGVALVVWAGLGVEALLISQAAFGVIGLVVALWLSRDGWLPVVDAGLSRRLLGVGVPLVPASLFAWVMTYSDRFFLVQLRDIGEVGLYALAVRLAMLLQVVTIAFETAWYPFAYASAQHEDHRARFARVLTAAMLVVLPLAAALGLFAREALILVTTAEYVAAYPYVGILALALVANAAAQVFVVGVQLSQRTWHIAWTAGVAAVLNIGLNVALIPPLGVLGAAVATFVAYAALAALLHAVGRRVYPIPYRFGRVLVVGGLVAAALVAGLVVDSRQPGTALVLGASLLKLAGLAVVVAVSLRLLDVELVAALRSAFTRILPGRGSRTPPDRR